MSAVDEAMHRPGRGSNDRVCARRPIAGGTPARHPRVRLGRRSRRRSASTRITLGNGGHCEEARHEFDAVERLGGADDVMIQKSAALSIARCEQLFR